MEAYARMAGTSPSLGWERASAFCGDRVQRFPVGPSASSLVAEKRRATTNGYPSLESCKARTTCAPPTREVFDWRLIWPLVWTRKPSGIFTTRFHLAGGTPPVAKI